MKRAMVAYLVLGGLLVGCSSKPTGGEGPNPPSGSAAQNPQAGAPPGPNPVVLMETSMGPITIELDQAKAPAMVKDFLARVEEKFYDGTIFHRVIGDSLVQGGGYLPGLKEKPESKPVRHRYGDALSNVRGTFAMAPTTDPDAVDAVPDPEKIIPQFIINVADNSKKLDRAHARDGIGCCVFGKVIEGMDVVDKIKAVKTTTRFREIEYQGRKINKAVADVPEKDVIILSVRRLEPKPEDKE